jgi:co-chaperonin GroES (HSP10)
MTETKLAFEPHKIEKGRLRPLRDYIVVTNMTFDQRITHGGIVLLNDDMKSSGIRPRWCQIYKFGPEYNGELKEGQWIYVAHGRWTRGIDIEDEEGKKTLRRVDPNDILLVSDEPMMDDYISDKAI